MTQRKPSDSAKVEPVTRSAGRFAYEGLDRAMHEKARLGILASLAANPGGVLFNDLKELCSLTDGNLSRHLAVLREAGLVETWKGPAGPRPQTMYRLTAHGRERFADYIGVLEKVVADARAEVRGKPNPRSLSRSWSPA